MSPEQAFGRAVDHRSDIYSFGIMTNEALTGRVVFDGESIMDVLFKHVNLAPPRMSERCPELPASLDEPVLRMLAKDPAGRPATVMEALDDLARAANEAGFNVPVPVRGGVPPARVSDRGIVVTPAGTTGPGGGVAITPAHAAAGTLAQAQTVVGDPTLAGASTDVAPRKGRRTLMIVGMVAGAIGLAAAGFALGRPPSSGPAEHRPQVDVTAVPSPAITAPPAVTPSATPAVTPSGSSDVGSASGEVEIQIDATPVPVDVFRGAEKIGTSAAPLKLKRGEKVKLTFRAPGYLPAEVEVSPTKSTLLPVKLTKQPAGKPASEVQW
jgi:serine/threonine-protein kinase